MRINIEFESLEEIDDFAYRWHINNSIRPVVPGDTVPAGETEGTLHLSPSPAVVVPLGTEPGAYSPTTIPEPAPAGPQGPIGAAGPAGRAVTIEDVIKAAVPLVDKGLKNELQAVLKSFGVNAIPELAPEQLGAFMDAIGSIGGGA